MTSNDTDQGRKATGRRAVVHNGRVFEFDAIDWSTVPVTGPGEPVRGWPKGTPCHTAPGPSNATPNGIAGFAATANGRCGALLAHNRVCVEPLGSCPIHPDGGTATPLGRMEFQVSILIDDEHTPTESQARAAAAECGIFVTEAVDADMGLFLATLPENLELRLLHDGHFVAEVELQNAWFVITAEMP